MEAWIREVTRFVAFTFKNLFYRVHRNCIRANELNWIIKLTLSKIRYPLFTLENLENSVLVSVVAQVAVEQENLHTLLHQLLVELCRLIVASVKYTAFRLSFKLALQINPLNVEV